MKKFQSNDLMKYRKSLLSEVRSVKDMKKPPKPKMEVGFKKQIDIDTENGMRDDVDEMYTNMTQQKNQQSMDYSDLDTTEGCGVEYDVEDDTDYVLSQLDMDLNRDEDENGYTDLEKDVMFDFVMENDRLPTDYELNEKCRHIRSRGGNEYEVNKDSQWCDDVDKTQSGIQPPPTQSKPQSKSKYKSKHKETETTTDFKNRLLSQTKSIDKDYTNKNLSQLNDREMTLVMSTSPIYNNDYIDNNTDYLNNNPTFDNMISQNHTYLGRLHDTNKGEGFQYKSPSYDEIVNGLNKDIDNTEDTIMRMESHRDDNTPYYQKYKEKVDNGIKKMEDENKLRQRMLNDYKHNHDTLQRNLMDVKSQIKDSGNGDSPYTLMLRGNHSDTINSQNNLSRKMVGLGDLTNSSPKSMSESKKSPLHRMVESKIKKHLKMRMKK